TRFLKLVERVEDFRVPGQDAFELCERLAFRTPKLLRIKCVCVRQDLNEFEEIAVDDQLDLSGAALVGGGLAADEIRELIVVVHEVVASLAVPHVEIADDDGYALLIHVSVSELGRRGGIAASTTIQADCS